MSMIVGSAIANTGLAGAIYTSLQTLSYFESGAAGQAFSDTLATAIVAYITAHATVVPTLLVAPPSGGPVTGTGTVT